MRDFNFIADSDDPVLFVSHHSSKLATAEHVERALNAEGVACWIAPRDIEPGEQWDIAIRKAIAASDAMLLLFCSASEQSKQVKRELILADQEGKAIIPLRLERIDPGQLTYHLADSQWIDWLERRDDVIDRIAAKARELRGRRVRAPRVDSDVPRTEDSIRPPGSRARPTGRHWSWIALAIVVTALAAGIAWYSLGRPSDDAAVTERWFEGVWSSARDCREPYRYDPGGQVTGPDAAQGEWSIEGSDTLVVTLRGERRELRIERVADDEVRSGDGPLYRCF